MTDLENNKHRMGLCADCHFMRTMRSDRGSIFILCERSKIDQTFPKYPRLPVLQCAGYERTHSDQRKAESGAE